MSQSPRYQLQRRGDSGDWITMATFSNLEEVASAVVPWSRIVPIDPIEPAPPGRTPLLLGIFIALVTGFSIGLICQGVGK